MLLYNEDHLQFKKWIFPLNHLESSNKNKNKVKEIEQFWQLFYTNELSLLDLSERYRYIFNKFNFGPQSLWFKWLYEMHICFIFIRKQMTIELISLELNIQPKDLVFILRDFFLRHYPNHEQFFNDKFSLSTFLTTNLQITFNDIEEKIQSLGKIPPLGIEDDDPDQNFDDLQSQKEWNSILRKLQKDFVHSKKSKIKLSSLLKRKYFWHQFVIFIELSLFVFLAFAAIMLLRFGLKSYENYGEKKLTLFAPDFLWPEQSMVYEIPYQKNRITNFSDIEDVQKIREKKFLPNTFDDDIRFETESDLALTSTEDINSLPENFHNESSEESYKKSMLIRKEFRDEQEGKNKVYRLVMRTSNIKGTSKKIKSLITRYSADQINANQSSNKNNNQNQNQNNYLKLTAGGEYYNLYVPKEILKEFIANVSYMEDSVLYVSKSSRGSFIDKSKVFIWLKEI
ncbi:MAG: hypothetical protein HQK51_13250 [Oligoflexia bacterium]|nr:hypothetical protein [Oligoflexia bacterium]